MKLKYLADNEFPDLNGDALREAVSDYIRNTDKDLVGKMVSQGTTPRRLTDLIGSLADLTSAVGDKVPPSCSCRVTSNNYTSDRRGFRDLETAQGSAVSNTACPLCAKIREKE